jgi:hypothetical protein
MKENIEKKSPLSTLNTPHNLQLRRQPSMPPTPPKRQPTHKLYLPEKLTKPCNLLLTSDK